MHPFVSGELACGNLKGRAETLSDLNALPSAKVASDSEARQLIKGRRLWGQGLGWADMHLLAAALLSHCRFRTLDKKLRSAAGELGLKP
jgi:hypothetical protein